MRVKIKRDTASSQAQLDRKHQTPLDVSARNKTELFGRVTTHTGLQQRSDQPHSNYSSQPDVGIARENPQMGQGSQGR